jgi:hypothetical protein
LWVDYDKLTPEPFKRLLACPGSTPTPGFRVRYGTASQNYTEELEVNDATTESLVIEGLAPATYYFVVTAFDLSENESAASLEVSKVVAP